MAIADELTPRERRVLQAVIQSYVKTAEPAGSRVISRRYGLGVSPATIRNTMSELEEKGFLRHPHTSAGRVPTDKAYRAYVDSLLDSPGTGTVASAERAARGPHAARAPNHRERAPARFVHQAGSGRAAQHLRAGGRAAHRCRRPRGGRCDRRPGKRAGGAARVRRRGEFAEAVVPHRGTCAAGGSFTSQAHVRAAAGRAHHHWRRARGPPTRADHGPPP